jgi:hypothetical protein
MTKKEKCVNKFTSVTNSRYSPYAELTLLSVLCAASLSSLTLLAPLANFPRLDGLVNIVLSLMQVRTLGHESDFPDAARIYFSFTVPMCITFYGLIWRWAKSNDGKASNGLLFVKNEKFGVAHRLGLILLTPLWIALIAGGWLGFLGGNSRLFHLGTSLPALISFGWIFPAGIAVCLFLFIGSIKKALTGKL